MSISRRILLVWLLISFIFWAFYILLIEFIPQVLYFYVIILFFGIPLWINQKQVAKKLKQWKIKTAKKFFIIGYGVVFFEEIFAALFNHLSESFVFTTFLQRIGQYCFLNIFIFTGFYFAWYYILKRYSYTFFEAFIVAGLWGLFIERVFLDMLTNPLPAFFAAPIVLFVYGIMIVLPMMSLELSNKKTQNLIIKFLLPFVLMFLFSMLPILISENLRETWPFLFPPKHLVP